MIEHVSHVRPSNQITASNVDDFCKVEKAVAAFNISMGIDARMSTQADHLKFFAGKYDPEYPFVVMEFPMVIIKEHIFKFRKAFASIENIHVDFTDVGVLTHIEGTVNADGEEIRVAVHVRVWKETPLSLRFISGLSEGEGEPNG